MLEDLMRECRLLALPENGFYMQGKSVSDAISLPRDILIFAHDNPPSTFSIHSRYMLIIPFDPMTYILDDYCCYELARGDALFSVPYQKRRMSYAGKGCYRLMVTFSFEGELPFYLPKQARTKLSETACRQLSSLLSAYRDEDYFRCACDLALLLRELAAHIHTDAPPSLPPVIRLAVNYINYSRSEHPATLQAIAAYAGTSVSNLRQLFRKEMGISIGQFIARNRMELARQQLRGGTMRVDEISRLCGFASIYAFSHFFRKHAGVSPSRYRQAEWEKNPGSDLRK